MNKSSHRPLRLVWVVLLGTLHAGCAHDHASPPSPSRAAYQLGHDDVLAVEVWKEPALSAKAPVRPDGMISLPMIGELRAAGRTAAQLREEIARRLRPLVHDPVVTVMVSEIHAARFFVLGEVAHPGAYPVHGAVSVLQALAMAGGPTEFASRRSILVIRPGLDGTEARFKVNLSAIVAGRARALELTAGDTVYVP